MRQKQHVQTQVLIQPEEDETMGQSISGLNSGSNFLPDIRFTQEVGTMLLIIQNMTIAQETKLWHKIRIRTTDYTVGT